MSTAKSYNDYIYDLQYTWDMDIYEAAYTNLRMTGGAIDTKINSTRSTIDRDRIITEFYKTGLVSRSVYNSYLKKKDRYENVPGAYTLDAFLKIQAKIIRDAEMAKVQYLFKQRYAEVLNRRRTEIAEAEGRDQVFGNGKATLSGGSANTTVVDASGGKRVVNLSGGDPTPIGTRVTLSHTVIEKNNSWVAKPNTGQDPNQLDRRPAWIDTNTEFHRTKTNQGMIVDSAIIKRYYSVVDAEIYFGNEYVEDVADISWQIIQNVQPLFGYNSYTYDELARGNRLIHGSFLINFTNPNYLFAILEAANKANVTNATGMTDYSVPAYTSEGSNLSQSVKGRNTDRERGHHANIWPQTFDIDVIFGEKSGAGLPVHIILLGCAIQACQQVLSASATGGPPVVMEQYSFIGQDIRTIVASSGHIAQETNLNNVATDSQTDNQIDDTEQESDDSTESSVIKTYPWGNGPSIADLQRLEDTYSTDGMILDSHDRDYARRQALKQQTTETEQDDVAAQNRQQGQAAVAVLYDR